MLIAVPLMISVQQCKCSPKSQSKWEAVIFIVKWNLRVLQSVIRGSTILSGDNIATEYISREGKYLKGISPVSSGDLCLCRPLPFSYDLWRAVTYWSTKQWVSGRIQGSLELLRTLSKLSVLRTFSSLICDHSK